jgi:murein tripeptide amidase MpaA
MAAIHAREYTTAELVTRYAEYLVTNYGVDPDVTWLLDNFEVHILPQANPDGRVIAEGGYYQRKNTNPSGANNCPSPRRSSVSMV